ncbi:MAG: EpsG family protein [Tissierellales bacterium]|nr:EpsG family protein [Tissierellales bacterium]
MFILLLLLSFFRYGVGADYFAYSYLYSRLNSSIIKELVSGLDNQEVLFRLLGSSIKSLGTPYQLYLIILASINLYFIYKLCKKYSLNPRISILIYYSFYYFVWTFSGLRQGLTISIGLYYLLEALEKERINKLIIVTIILTFIHSSSIILLPMYLFLKKDHSKSIMILLLIFSIGFALLPLNIVINRFIGVPILNRVAPYLVSDARLINIFDFQTFGRLFFVGIILYYYDNNFSINSTRLFSKKLNNMYLISIILYFFLKSSELTASRIAIYGSLIIIIQLSNFLYTYNNNKNRILYFIFLIFISFLYLNKELLAMKSSSGLITDFNIYVPYTNIFNKENFVFINQYFKFLQ